MSDKRGFRFFEQLQADFASQLAHVPIQQTKRALRLVGDWLRVHSRWLTWHDEQLAQLKQRVDELEIIVSKKASKKGKVTVINTGGGVS